MFRHRSWIIAVLAVFASVQFASARPATAPQCFTVPGISDCIDGRIKEFWNANGGLPVFGYPITAQRPEVNTDTKQTYQTQRFERNRFELHPENQAPYDVLLGRLGAEGLTALGRGFEGVPAGTTPQGRCKDFDAGGKRQVVCDPFLRYWESNGLEFDGKAGKSYNESLALFGLPLTYPKTETNRNGDTVRTQWFERGRFEDHGSKGVLLGLLGREAGAAPTPPTNPAPPTANLGDCAPNAPAVAEGAQAWMATPTVQRRGKALLCVRLTLSGQPVAGATALSNVLYSTGPQPLSPVPTQSNGVAQVSFDVGPVSDSTVKIQVDVLYKDVEYATTTSFRAQ